MTKNRIIKALTADLEYNYAQCYSGNGDSYVHGLISGLEIALRYVAGDKARALIDKAREAARKGSD